MKVKVGLISKATCRHNSTYICCNATNSNEKYDVRVGLFGSSTFEVQFAACQNGDISYLFSRCASRITFGKIYIELRKTCFFCRKSRQHFYTRTLTHENKHIFRFSWIFVENRIAFLCDLPYWVWTVRRIHGLLLKPVVLLHSTLKTCSSRSPGEPKTSVTPQ